MQERENRIILHNFGERFRSYRIREQLSLGVVSSILNISSSAIRRLENGARKPPNTINFWQRLTLLPNLSIDEFKLLIGAKDVAATLTMDEQKGFVDWYELKTGDPSNKKSIIDTNRIPYQH